MCVCGVNRLIEFRGELVFASSSETLKVNLVLLCGCKKNARKREEKEKKGCVYRGKD